jgi:hypothetical protein
MAVAAVCPRGIDRAGRDAMQKWEYASVPLIVHSIKEILDQWGELGYELVGVVDLEGAGPLALLKHPKD